MSKYHKLREMANGVSDERGKFFPYKIAVDTVTAKTNIRYFIKSITLSSGQDAATAAAVDKVEATVKGVSAIIATNMMPATFAASQSLCTYVVYPSLLCDNGTAITVTLASKTPYCCIVYAEVDELTGEYDF